MADTIYYVDGTDVAATHHFLTAGAALAHLKSDHPDLTADNGSGGAGFVGIEISITSAETAVFNVVGLTTSAACYLRVYTTPAARHAGVWSNSKHRIAVSEDGALVIQEDYVRLDGLQLSSVRDTASGDAVYTNVGADLRVSNCLIKVTGGNTYYHIGLDCSVAPGAIFVWNTVVYVASTNGNTVGIYAPTGGAATLSVYSCAVKSGAYGIYRAGTGTITAKNTYCSGTAGNAFNGTITKTNCASSGTEAGTADGCLSNIACDTDTFVNVTAGSEDLHLAADGLSPLQGHGVNTTGDSAPLNFTTDIDGQTIGASWSIGADNIAGSGLSVFVYESTIVDEFNG